MLEFVLRRLALVEYCLQLILLINRTKVIYIVAIGNPL